MKERIDAIRRLLKGIETGDPEAARVVNEAKYIQHNPQTHEGSEGLAALFARISKTNPRVNMVRGFADGDYVFAHMEYDFATRRIGFEVFRFEGAHAVEHWDNIQPRLGPNPSGRSMVDGPTDAADASLTEATRTLARRYAEEVLIERTAPLEDFVAPDLIQHSPELGDGREALEAYLDGPEPAIRYRRLHRVLADGDFALTVCEGERGGVHTAFYDLHRVADGRIIEHWDTVEAVPPRAQWKNENGKF